MPACRSAIRRVFVWVLACPHHVGTCVSMFASSLLCGCPHPPQLLGTPGPPSLHCIPSAVGAIVQTEVKESAASCIRLVSCLPMTVPTLE